MKDSRPAVTHPGETLAELLEQRGWTSEELVEQLVERGVARAGLATLVDQVLEGQARLTGRLAEGLALTLGTPRDFWSIRESLYQSKLAQQVDHQGQITGQVLAVRRSQAELLLEGGYAFVVTVGPEAPTPVVGQVATLQVVGPVEAVVGMTGEWVFPKLCDR